MHRSSFFGALAVLSLLFLGSGCGVQSNEKRLLFSYFMGNGEDGLHLAASSDGLNWLPINEGKSLLLPLVGESVLMRDPCITQGPDGMFHMVWTTSWSGNTIGYASSKDLINWSKQKVIPVMAHEDSVMNSWAPEINYNESQDNFLIYWSSTVTNQFLETASSTKNGKKRNHRIYYTTTRDFESFTDTKLFYDPGYNVIDASIVPFGDHYAMFVKNETELPKAEKNISVVFSKSMTGPFETTAKPITGDYWAEGPTAVEVDGKWHLYFDKYRKGKFGVLTSTDMTTWSDESESLAMPEGIRHGTVFEVSNEVYQKLQRTAIDVAPLYRDVTRKGRPFAKDPTIAKFNGQYFMYYSIPPGDQEDQQGWHIGVAVSKDLQTWKKVSEILPAASYEAKGLCAPESQVIDGKLHLFYQTYGNRENDAICHAVSVDGINFTRNNTNPIFSPTGKWNVGRAIDAEVYIKEDTAFLYWATRDATYTKQLLGVSSAPLSGNFDRDSWTQLSSSPLLKPELSWEKNCIEAASVFAAHGKYFMFYAGAYNHEGQQIGLAVSDDLINWERTSADPVLPKGKSNEWNAWESGHPGVYVDDDGSKWLFYQGNPDQGYSYYLSQLRFDIDKAGKLRFW